MITDLNNQLSPLLNEVVTTTPIYLDSGRTNENLAQPSTLGQLVNKSLVVKTGAQIAIINGGGIRMPIDAGDITIGEVYDVLPFDNYVYTMDMKTEDIKAAIEHGIYPFTPDNQISWGQYYGITVVYDHLLPAKNRIIKMYYNDPTDGYMHEMINGETYSVAINDFMYTGGDKYNFTNATNVKSTGILLRDMFVDYLDDSPVVDFAREDLLLTIDKMPYGNLIIDASNKDQQFEIYDTYGQLVDAVSTDENGNVSIPLSYGKYYIQVPNSKLKSLSGDAYFFEILSGNTELLYKNGTFSSGQNNLLPQTSNNNLLPQTGNNNYGYALIILALSSYLIRKKI